MIKVRYGRFENWMFRTGDFLITQRMFVTTFLVQCCLVLSSHSQWNLQRAKKLILKDYIASEGKQDYSYVSRSLYFRLTKIKHLTTFQSLKYAECLRVYARITELQNRSVNRQCLYATCKWAQQLPTLLAQERCQQMLPLPSPRGILFTPWHSAKFQICRLGSHRNFACVKTLLFKSFHKWPNMANFTTENNTYCFRIGPAFLDTGSCCVRV